MCHMFFLCLPSVISWFSLHCHVISQMMLTPAMQGVILAIAKARQIFDKEGPEAGLIKVFFVWDIDVLLITHQL